MRTLLRRAPIAFVAVFAVFAACADDPTPTGAPSLCGADDECPDGNCVAGVCVGGADDVSPDDGAPDVGAVDARDTGDEDTAGDTAPDAAPDIEACEGEFGCACESDDECLSGVCIDTAEGSVCTAYCTDACPDPDWECRLIRGSGGDLVEICIPPLRILCRECDADIDCGGLDDLCLPQADGDFCGRDCSADDAECPAGFLCQAFERPRGGERTTYRQCAPELGVCGGCVDLDGDRYGDGPECLGTDCDELEAATFEGAPELCDGRDNDCDDDVDEDYDLNADMAHCGRCGAVCDADNATVDCLDGVCTILECDAGFDDCNDDVADGCEEFTDESLTHCGACGEPCDFDNGIAECFEGTCGLDTCRDGWGNCNSELEDGCEADLTTSFDHCGACRNACHVLHGVGECVEGGCVQVECTDPWFDCNLDPGDGCEVDRANDPLNCGACGEACALDFVIEHVCDGGACGIGECETGRVDCNETAGDGCEVDVLRDIDNCGECGFDCDLPDARAMCIDGSCAVSECIDAYRDCNRDPEDGCEVDTNTDPLNCGFCGGDCHAPSVVSATCELGGCVILECASGTDDCNDVAGDGCEQYLLADPLHCGECRRACDAPGAISECVVGECNVLRCADGFIDLDGDLSNGCSYECTFIFEDDRPDDGFLDADCDGVDGEAGNSVFVLAGAAGGGSGLFAWEPVPTIAAGLAIAAERPERHAVLVANGTYTGPTLDVPTGVSIYGGYSSDFRTRGDSHATYNSTSATALRVASTRSGVMIERVDFTTPNQGTNGWTAAVVVSDSANNVTLRRTNITAGNGGDGSVGDGGGDGNAGDGGANASGSSGGGGGVVGGGGGASGRRQSAGPAGGAGDANGAPCGGSAGGGSGGSGLGCGDGDPRPGGPGGDGCVGSDAAHGAGGNGTGALAGTTWSPGNGGDGSRGGTGGGGGGGGAGGGEDCEEWGVCVFCGTGRGGGGGGGGGTGGHGGRGGRGGGASIGLIVVDSTVALNNAVIAATDGGDGGAGGDRGTGGPGGPGGSGATTSSNEEGDGGDGGNGRGGGLGGCGGGGGGGPSIGIAGIGSAAVIRGTAVTIALTSPGDGGASCGNSGATGIAVETRSIEVR